MGCAPSQITDDEIIALLFLIAPQFVTDDPEKIAGYKLLIKPLRCLVNERLLGCCAALAFANLLAHYLTMKGNAFLGIANSISEGQLSISVANTVGGNFWGSSPYGQAYWQLISNFKFGPYITNSRGGWRGPSCCGSGFGYGF